MAQVGGAQTSGSEGSPSEGPRPFRFGWGLWGETSRKAWVDKVRRAEDLGFDIVALADHLIGMNFSFGVGLMAAAEATERVRLSTMVANNGFRHPVMLAKEAASLDVLSDGRLELGVGAGWWQLEHEQAGMPFEAPAVRIRRLSEAVDILKALWTEDDVTYAGEHYQLAGLTLEPKPVQDPHPPISLGGGGRMVLSLAARKADIVHLTLRTVPDGADPSDKGAEAFVEKLGWVRQAAGDRIDQIELAVSIGIVARDERSVADGRHPSAMRQLELAKGTPLVLLGGTDEICDQLRYWRDEHGITQYSIMNEIDLELFAPVVAKLAGS